MPLPILYSYRRCPFAMRARMALQYAGIAVEHREISLRDKPKSMLLVSPKGTVPVLCIDDIVLDQSLDIMQWALEKSDPDGWNTADQVLAQSWIEKNDGPFKKILDQYKYPNRYPNRCLNQDPNLSHAAVLRTAMELMLQPMELALESSQFLLGNKTSWVDIAIFPFIRQFSMVNPSEFSGLPLPRTKEWLSHFLQSELFGMVMNQYPVWVE
ncbi:glutathione S-transferase [Polynucleobacter sp. TUM22923]|uniref:glutathione S-transferase n=1 Tax=Polynucleobacter sp. TUM22923 TaxID=3022126 RepID=UPI002573CFAB|nr:glutathione S-transferase [Polynucleobacter sp. TUM22923]